ncbi:MAG: hypothetical protein IKU82_04620 [Clostridia bacterium]|nr:hypothetical protein [Clostridia bacterium]
MTVSFFALLIVVLSAVLAQYKQLQILQQHSYSLTTYFKWVWQSYTIQLALSTIAYCGITLLFSKNKDWFALIIAVLILVARVVSTIMTQKTQSVKLIFTARAKRLYVAAIVILFISLFISVLTNTDAAQSVEQIGKNIFLFPDIMVSEISRTVCTVLSVISPLLTLVVWVVTLPIEKLLDKKKTDDVNVVSQEIEDNETATETEQEVDVPDYTYESLLKEYDDSKGAKF